MYILPSVPNICPRMCCNSSGPSTLKWKQHTVKLVKLCEILGVTNFGKEHLNNSRRRSRDVMGVIILVVVSASVVIGGVVGAILFVARVPFHAVLISGVVKLFKIATIYFVSLGAIALLGTFILLKTEPTHREYERYLWRSVNRWLDNNELDKVYRTLPLLDVQHVSMARQVRRILIERLIDNGCTNLMFFDNLSCVMEPNDEEACYERIAKKIYEKDKDVKTVLSILLAHIQNPAKRAELLEYYAQLQIEEGELLHAGTQEMLTDAGLPLGIPELVTEYVGSPQLEMARMFVSVEKERLFVSGIECSEESPNLDQLYSRLAKFYQKNYHTSIARSQSFSNSSVIFEQFSEDINHLLIGLRRVIPDTNHVKYREILAYVKAKRQAEKEFNRNLLIEQELIHALRAVGQA